MMYFFFHHDGTANCRAGQSKRINFVHIVTNASRDCTVLHCCPRTTVRLQRPARLAHQSLSVGDLLNMRIIALAAATASMLPPEVGAGRALDSAVEYRFDRADCLSGHATDTSSGKSLFGSLNINTSAVTCKGLGVEAKSGILHDQRIASSSNASLFVDEMSRSDGFTFEVWASFENFPTSCESCSARHMVSIGSTDAALVPSFCADASNLFFYQTRDHSVGISLRQEPKCISIIADHVIALNSVVHVILTVEPLVTDLGSDSTTSDFSFDDYSTFRWHFDGVLVTTKDVKMASLTSPWSDDFYLQMLNDAVAVRHEPTIYAPPSGTLFLLAMYVRALNSTEVAQNYEAGLENSPPVAEDIAAIINEEGEIGDNYDNPAYYMQDPTVPTLNLSSISLVVVDLDAQEGFPGFDAEMQSVPNKVTIERLPSRGQLFEFSGKAISSVPHDVMYDDGYHVRFRPVKDEFSGSNDVYTSFTYSVIDAVTGEECVTPGVVSMYVLAKNDPPLPTNKSEMITTGRDNTIYLCGTDVDSSEGDAIQGSMIIEPPTHGLLFQVRHELA